MTHRVPPYASVRHTANGIMESDINSAYPEAMERVGAANEWTAPNGVHAMVFLTRDGMALLATYDPQDGTWCIHAMRMWKAELLYVHTPEKGVESA